MSRILNKKKAVLAAVLSALLLTACGGETPETETVSSIENQIHGIIIDAGEVNALCPDGWNSAGVPDLSAESADTVYTDALRFVKGGTSPEELLKNPFVDIHYYKSEQNIPEIEPHKWYDNVADTGEIVTGEYTWSGYSGSSLGKPFVYLQTVSNSGAFTAMIYTQEGAQNAISLNSPEVLAILTSIAVSK